MFTTKPVVDPKQALALLREQFDAHISPLDNVEVGQVAQIFYFAAGGSEYILRFNRHTEINFGKEAYLYRTIDVLRIPIPPIVRIGRLDTLHYAISHYIPGTPLDRLPHAEVRALIPQLIETLDAIHAVDVRSMARSDH
jgi:hygromycin-B 4-O-kinase